MEQLIKITTNDKGTKIVSARELYQFLEVGSIFTTWCNRMFEYGFEEGKDFLPILEESNGGRPSTDYALTLDTAKEIAMIQRSEKGKLARKYFIECEKQLLEISKPKELPANYLEALKALVKSEEEKVLIQQKAEKAERTVSILMHVNKTYVATEIAKELGFKSANELNKRLHEKGIQFKQNDTWVLYSKYANLGYVEIKQEVLDNGKVVYHRRFTQMGREFLLNLFEVK